MRRLRPYAIPPDFLRLQRPLLLIFLMRLLLLRRIAALTVCSSTSPWARPRMGAGRPRRSLRLLPRRGPRGS